MRFRTTLQLNGKTVTGIPVPEEVVEGLGSGKPPPSLVLFPASVFIQLGRLLTFVWSIAVGPVLTLGKRRETGAEL